MGRISHFTLAHHLRSLRPALDVYPELSVEDEFPGLCSYHYYLRYDGLSRDLNEHVTKQFWTWAESSYNVILLRT
ncbi:hypothetical protein QCA50_011522 [Cerrena zonata]|uniref:Uncharacterized protein n=1 Tax=Cerrena zonata TaxID=2478898 RepID=A0AAW0G1B9_9APHY